MSPVIKRKEERFHISDKFLLFVLTFFCSLLMVLTFGTTIFNKPLNAFFGYLVVPFEQGIGKAGGWLSNRSMELVEIKRLLNENQELKDQIAVLTEENTLLQQDKYELNKLRQLMQLDKQYDEYNKVGARIIARDSGNWYTTFIIDKGSNDGLALDMNVIAGGGLVGRITDLGANWSKVTAIISDNSNVSGMTLATENNLIVSGNLQLMSGGVIEFKQLVDSQDLVKEGDKIVTSDISDKYLPGILIGYIKTINIDNNNLTKSGYLTPAVDFEHLSEVLVITDLKQQIEE